MKRIATILVIIMVYKFVGGISIPPINIRLSPIFVKQEIDAADGYEATATGVFSKIPQAPVVPDYREDFNSKTYIPDIAKLGIKCTNQIAKVLFPDHYFNASNRDTTEQFLKIPIISQPFNDYKIIVATAPWKMRISGSEPKPAVVYFVFPEDDDEPTSMNIPEIYFVKKGQEPTGISKKDKIDPLIIVDSNRTVTGLKSNTVSKFIKFKNKLNH